MTLRSWLRQLLVPTPRTVRTASARCRPTLEALEDRTVPAVSMSMLGTPYAQSFDTLPASGSATWTNNSTIPGWFHARTGTGTTIVALAGSSNAGNLYSFGTGTATDRALGSVGTANAAIGNLFWGVALANNTGATITSLDVTYTGEQWRNSTTAAQTISFSYLVGSPDVTGSLAEFQSAGVAVPSLDFTSPITGGADAVALDGNLAANRVTRSFTITGLSIPNGAEVMLRWSDPDHTGLDHGLAIDDFSVTPYTLTPIHDIQGPGASSPIVGASVTTRGIVTGVKSNGFFLQAPDAEVDADPATSEGIFVFTGSIPPDAVVVGNEVRVTGTVAEFVPAGEPLQPPLTQITSPTVVLLSTGNPLPAAVSLSTTFPDPAGPFDQLERLEGMRVSVSSLTVTAPTQGSVNEVTAASTSDGVFFGVVTGVARPFREPGIQAPDPAPAGTIPPIPRWDHNPELLRIDSDGLVGTSPLDVGTGAVVTGLVGPLDYASRYYTILPDANSQLTVAGGPTLTSVTPSAADEFTVASYNLDRFFDSADDPAIGEPVLTAAAFDKRLNKASLAIRNNLRMPDILAVQGVENLATLQALAARINSDAVAAGQSDPRYVAYLVEGHDVTGLDVGFLVKTAPVSGSTPRVIVDGMAAVQERAGTLFVNPDSSTEVLHERPPLRLMATISHPSGARFPVTVINVHPSSMLDIDSLEPGSNGWAAEGDRVRARRQKQAEDIANLVQARQLADPDERILVAGDFNSFEFNDGHVHFLGTLAGTPSPDNVTAVPGDGADLVNPDLVNLVDTAPAAERYTRVLDGSAASLDHILANAPLLAATRARRVEHARSNADSPETARNDGTIAQRLSAHDPIVGYFKIPVNEAPTDITLSNAIVAENRPSGTVVGALSTTDPDVGDTHTYSFAGGPDDALFTLDGNQLKAAAGFNFEARASYRVRVRSTDAGGLSTEKDFTVSVTDVDEVVLRGVRVQNGQRQRSRLTSVQVVFSGPVSLLPGAFQLRRGSKTIRLRERLEVSDSQAVVTLTFRAGNRDRRPLADGRYVLSIDGGRVRDGSGRPLADLTEARFFRLYGDTNGNGVIDATDRKRLRSLLGGDRAARRFRLLFLPATGDDLQRLIDAIGGL